LKRIDIDGVVAADGFSSRLFGLMGRRDLSGARLWFPRCTSVHTFFMRAPIDIVFLDRERVVVSLHEKAKPWRMFRGGRGADSVLELSAGFARQRELETGDRLQWQD
jgi:uncharacterized membrane protein (UPF0127 family)